MLNLTPNFSISHWYRTALASRSYQRLIIIATRYRYSLGQSERAINFCCVYFFLFFPLYYRMLASIQPMEKGLYILPILLTFSTPAAAQPSCKCYNIITSEFRTRHIHCPFHSILVSMSTF